jgi:hypothetical protein
VTTRNLYKLALAIACLDIVGLAYANSLKPAAWTMVLAGLCASMAVTAGKYLWRTRPAKKGLRA